MSKFDIEGFQSLYAEGSSILRSSQQGSISDTGKKQVSDGYIAVNVSDSFDQFLWSLISAFMIVPASSIWVVVTHRSLFYTIENLVHRVRRSESRIADPTHILPDLHCKNGYHESIPNIFRRIAEVEI